MDVISRARAVRELGEPRYVPFLTVLCGACSHLGVEHVGDELEVGHGPVEPSVGYRV